MKSFLLTITFVLSTLFSYSQFSLSVKKTKIEVFNYKVGLNKKNFLISYDSGFLTIKNESLLIMYNKTLYTKKGIFILFNSISEGGEGAVLFKYSYKGKPLKIIYTIGDLTFTYTGKFTINDQKKSPQKCEGEIETIFQ